MDRNGHICIAMRMRINTNYKVCVCGMRKQIRIFTILCSDIIL